MDKDQVIKEFREKFANPIWIQDLKVYSADNFRYGVCIKEIESFLKTKLEEQEREQTEERKGFVERIVTLSDEIKRGRGNKELENET